MFLETFRFLLCFAFHIDTAHLDLRSGHFERQSICLNPFPISNDEKNQFQVFLEKISTLGNFVMFRVNLSYLRENGTTF